MSNVSRFPLEKARALPLPAKPPSPAGAAAARPLEPFSPAADREPAAAPPPMHLSLLQVAANCVELARLAGSGEFVEDVSVLRAKCSEDLLLALAAGIEQADEPLRDALTFLLGTIKHYCEADSLRCPIWARAISPSLATVRDLFNVVGR